jgi:hypothetical protein
MKMPAKIPAALLAPCGIDCAACYARLRKKKACPGCLLPDEGKPGYCRACRIKSCAAGRGLTRCYGCGDFPCSMVKRIDKRYLTGYGVGLIENGLAARSLGMRKFMDAERGRWACPECGGIVSQHGRVCSECGREFDFPPDTRMGRKQREGMKA